MCIADENQRITIPKWMTAPESEHFTISNHPTIDPFSLIEAYRLINSMETFQINDNLDTFDRRDNHKKKEVEHELRSNETNHEKATPSCGEHFT
ncbi:MAG: hypothetical protein OMM_10136 [Candidatus Magnetoglobus multicellularis str. Araruama]|uniref:Uncharacterized protein n=1 Tax=Candidatus Magnetoglobus multicellularis str. Araruama TaxID=890399 RepID=A0A1V1P1Y1_9BACT|nr:MAG: hypothetical protein OMM_10136 [Candidatus Magnetoglobus multicellularis str. Araruama]